ncbi:hypothetical protein G6F40_015338 [Rhizopus arrhizus]|nr:hypothetical protein G6F40_015338 [Rhizopus arrhizus]
MTLRDILKALRDTYCRSIGAEFTHISDPAAKRWIQERLETTLGAPAYSVEEKRHILQQLTERRLADPDDGPHHPQRRQGWRQGRGDRHGPPRPPEPAREHHGQDDWRPVRRVRRHAR